MFDKVRMLGKGLRFGMLLQLAVGPVCLLTFRAASSYGFVSGAQVALAAALVDALFVALSGAGAAAVIDRPKMKAAMRWMGWFVLVAFGANILLGALDIPLLPNIALFTASGGSLFWQGFVLTAANPLTIIFWSGMFTAKMIENHWDKRQLVFFAAGCVLSTVLSLTAVAVLGSALSGFLSQGAITILNIAVGAVLIFYGFKLLLHKEKPVKA